MTVLLRQPAFLSDDRGQSMVELALTLPLLLLIVIGIVDVGRIYAYSIATTNAAHEAAITAARDPQARLAGVDTIGLSLGPVGDVTGICQRARDELGIGTPPVGQSPCTTAPVTVECLRGGTPCGDEPRGLRLFQNDGAGGADVSVTVTYQLDLLTSYLVGRVIRVNPVQVHATASYMGLGQ
jgi:hypothetical protein